MRMQDASSVSAPLDSVPAGKDGVQQSGLLRDPRPSDFVLLRVIGRGAFGKVLQVAHRGSGRVYAMKIYSKKFLSAEGQLQYTIAEKAIMARLRHPYIVPLRYAFQTHDRLFLLSDYCPGGELFHCLGKQGLLLEAHARVYIAQLVTALQYMHAHGVCHRDLKPENILLDSSGMVQVTDYGLAKDFVQDRPSTTEVPHCHTPPMDAWPQEWTTRSLVGTDEYLSPEMIHASSFGRDILAQGLAAHEVKGKGGKGKGGGAAALSGAASPAPASQPPASVAIVQAQVEEVTGVATGPGTPSTDASSVTASSLSLSTAEGGGSGLPTQLLPAAEADVTTAPVVSTPAPKHPGYGPSVDWWALGCLAFEMLTGEPPFTDKAQGAGGGGGGRGGRKELYRRICHEKPAFPKYLSPTAVSLVKSLLERDIGKRLGCGGGDARAHPFFKGVDWRALETRSIPPPIPITVTSALDYSHFDPTFTSMPLTLDLPTGPGGAGEAAQAGQGEAQGTGQEGGGKKAKKKAAAVAAAAAGAAEVSAGSPSPSPAPISIRASLHARARERPGSARHEHEAATPKGEGDKAAPLPSLAPAARSPGARATANPYASPTLAGLCMPGMGLGLGGAGGSRHGSGGPPMLDLDAPAAGTSTDTAAAASVDPSHVSGFEWTDSTVAHELALPPFGIGVGVGEEEGGQGQEPQLLAPGLCISLDELHALAMGKPRPGASGQASPEVNGVGGAEGGQGRGEGQKDANRSARALGKQEEGRDRTGTDGFVAVDLPPIPNPAEAVGKKGGGGGGGTPGPGKGVGGQQGSPAQASAGKKKEKKAAATPSPLTPSPAPAAATLSVPSPAVPEVAPVQVTAQAQAVVQPVVQASPAPPAPAPLAKNAPVPAPTPAPEPVYVPKAGTWAALAFKDKGAGKGGEPAPAPVPAAGTAAATAGGLSAAAQVGAAPAAAAVKAATSSGPWAQLQAKQQQGAVLPGTTPVPVPAPSPAPPAPTLPPPVDSPAHFPTLGGKSATAPSSITAPAVTGWAKVAAAAAPLEVLGQGGGQGAAAGTPKKPLRWNPDASEWSPGGTASLVSSSTGGVDGGWAPVPLPPSVPAAAPGVKAGDPSVGSSVWQPASPLPPFRLGLLLLMCVAPSYNLRVLEYARAARQEQDVQWGQTSEDGTGGWWRAVAHAWGVLWCIPKVLHRLGEHPALPACATTASVLAYALLGMAGERGMPRPAMGGFMLWAPVVMGLPSLIVDALELCLMWRVSGVGEVHTRIVLLLGWMSLAVLQTFIIAWVAITGDEVKRTEERQAVLQSELKARDRLIESQRQAEAAQRKFTRYIFHEVRTPFNSLDMGLALLEEEERTRLSKDGRVTLGMLVKAAHSMRVIINDTLDWAKIESGTFNMVLGPANIASIIQSTVLSMAPLASSSDHRVQLSSEVDRALPAWTLADGVRIQQVIGNLISNAIKFSPKDGTGRVTVHAHVLQTSSLPTSRPFSMQGVWWKQEAGDSLSLCEQQTETPWGSIEYELVSPATGGSLPDDAIHKLLSALTLPTVEHWRWLDMGRKGYRRSSKYGAGTDRVGECLLLIEVQDNGEGIAKTDVPTLFQAFKQLDAGLQYRSKGTGLGLAICHEIVSMHGGRLGVRSSGIKGEGAAFLVALRLPVLEHASCCSTPLASHRSEARSAPEPEPAPFVGIDVRDTVSSYILSRDKSAGCAMVHDAAAVRKDSSVPPPHPTSTPIVQAASSPRQLPLIQPLFAQPVLPPTVETTVAVSSRDPTALDPAWREPRADTSPDQPSAPSYTTPGVLGRAEQPVDSIPGAVLGDDPVSTAQLDGKRVARDAGRALRVLVVDDAPDNRKLLARTLKIKLGKVLAAGAFGDRFDRVQVDMADDGDTAVEKAVGILACVAQEYAHTGRAAMEGQHSSQGSIILGQPAPSVRTLAADCKYDVITCDAEIVWLCCRPSDP